MSLTINILVKNNEKTIEETLKCAKSISKNITVGNIGSKDNTIKICEKYNCRIIDVPFNNDFSYSKNYMLERNKSWIMFLNPNELTISKFDKLNTLLMDESVAYRLKLVRDDLITKEIRIWHVNSGIKFKNPAFESPDAKGKIKNLDLYLLSNKNYLDEDNIKAMNNWKSNNPISKELMYYTSCMHLIQNKWKDFINSAETYLHRNNSLDTPAIMTKYYLSMVKIYVKEEKDYNGSLKNIMQCLIEKPLMSEFWCLLGDLYYNVNDYKKAKSFYQNAIILGSKRIDEDDLPIEISKYKKYPLKMIENCGNIENSTQLFKANK